MGATKDGIGEGSGVLSAELVNKPVNIFFLDPEQTVTRVQASFFSVKA